MVHGSFASVVLVLLLGAVLSLGLRSNGSKAAAAVLSQLLATIVTEWNVIPILLGGARWERTWRWPAPIGDIPFRLDALGAFFLSWSLPMTLLGTIYAIAYLRGDVERGRNGGPHYALLNLVSLSFVLVYSVENALVFLLGWEIAALSAWLLVIWDYKSQKIRFAGFNYLVSTHIGLFVLVAAFMLLHSKTDSMDLARFGAFLAEPSSLRGTLFLLLGVSFALKSAFFPFHTWLPRAHSAAPAHVSALMSGVIHKAGLFAFLRFSLLMGRPDEWMGWGLLGFGALSAFFGVLYSSVQRDLKRLLGYSSTENVGIAAMGFGVGYLGWCWSMPALVLFGFAGGLLHVLNHALFKCLLFYAAGAVYRATHSVDIERLGGLARRLPRTTLLFLVGTVAIAALPPLNGFTSELLVYRGLLSGRPLSAQANIVFVVAAALMAFVSAVSALSMTRAFGITFLGTPRDPTIHASEDAPRPMLVPMVLHALGALSIGLAPAVGIAAVSGTLKLFPIGSGVEAATELLTPVTHASRALALLALVVGAWAWFRSRRARTSVTWACGYAAVNPRMQYTGSSFSQPLVRIFESILPSLRREKLPSELFPAQPGHLATHHIDPVERRMFEVLGQGEDFVSHASERIPEQPRFAFAAGLVALLVIVVLALGGVGR